MAAPKAPDARGRKLADLVGQRATLQADAKRAAKEAREEIEYLSREINRLAHEITSGQETLFEEPGE